MKLFNSLSSLLIVPILALLVCSCSSKESDPGPIPPDVCYDFVTFVDSNNSGSTFEFRKSGDSPLITLTSTSKIDKSQLAPGTRVIIQYVPSGGQAVYQSGPITLYGIAQITNGSITSASLTDIKSWNSDAIKIITLSRSGQYLDLWAECNLFSKPRRFSIVADESTLADQYPEVYIIVESDNSNGRVAQLYASFDLSAVWNLSTAKGISVNIKTAQGIETTRFDKDDRQQLQPGGSVN